MFQETLAITDKTYLMFEGNILKAGTPKELSEDKIVRKVYLGKNFELRKRNYILIFTFNLNWVQVYFQLSNKFKEYKSKWSLEMKQNKI